jgi:hypothetical protein
LSSWLKKTLTTACYFWRNTCQGRSISILLSFSSVAGVFARLLCLHTTPATVWGFL